MHAPSALMPTLVFDTVPCPRTGVETSPDTEGTSACATSAGGQVESGARSTRMIDLARLRQAFHDRQILHYDSIDSTQRAAASCEPGTIVLADCQLAGQGRHGHVWHSEPGAGIYCSLVLAPSPVLTLALGIATVEAIAQATGIQCDLRWPNDLMLDNRKAAGILVQLVNGQAIAGIGINVNQTEFPDDIDQLAT